MIYYQGESDGDAHPDCYRTLFPALIQNWRDLWGEELPFFFVQLAPLDHWMMCKGTPYAIVREAQQHTADTVPHTGWPPLVTWVWRLTSTPRRSSRWVTGWPCWQRTASMGRTSCATLPAWLGESWNRAS